jgi:hypothetical protein
MKPRGFGWRSMIAVAATLAAFGSVAPTAAQTATAPPQPVGWLLNQQSLIQPGVLPTQLERALVLTGSRMMSANTAQVTYIGTITDAQGPRTAQVTIQAPGYLLYQETQGHAVAFNGGGLQSVTGSLGAAGSSTSATPSTPLSSSDEAIAESLLANFPDMVCLQVAAGGSYRRIGSHFRTDNGKTANYTGPYWTILAFTPSSRSGLVLGSALQQDLFIAIDEQTGFISEVRVVVNTGPKQQQITQTQFSNWTQQAGQWYPGSIVRLESGQQTLSFQVQSVAVGAAGPTAVFNP